MNVKYSPTRWFTLTTDTNLSTFTREGFFEGRVFDFSAQQWSTKARGKLKLPKKFTVEFTGNYNSERESVQRVISDNLFMDLGVRKRMMKGKLTASLSVRDVFASRNRESVIDELNFYTNSHSQRGRFIAFGLSFGFGKGEAMEFSSKKRF